MGMGFVVQIGNTSDVPPPPQGTQFCGVVPQLRAPTVQNPFVKKMSSNRT